MHTANWWTTFFQGLSVEMWLRFEDPARTKTEVDFVERTLSLSAGESVLDVPCGGGRHALELASRGLRVTGVDLSSEFLANARSRPVAPGAALELLEHDMRDLPWAGRFDAAYCVGNSFAYMDDAGNEAFLKAVQRALKPGGRFLLETSLLLESVVPHLGEHQRTWYQVGDLYFLAERRHSPLEGRLTSDYTFITGGRVEKRQAIYRTYSFRELCGLCDKAQLRLKSTFGSMEGTPYVTGNQVIYLLLEKA